jgi:hypothetical protein
MKSGNICFATITQAVIFEHELKGQLSDGWWENASPNHHWSMWCSADVRYITTSEDAALIGRDFHPRKDSYNFTNEDLLEAVGRRMCLYAQIAKAFGAEDVDLLRNLFEFCGNNAPLTRENIIKDSHAAALGAWCRERSLTFEQVQLEVTKQMYNEADLRNDLKVIKRACKMFALDAGNGTPIKSKYKNAVVTSPVPKAEEDDSWVKLSEQ